MRIGIFVVAGALAVAALASRAGTPDASAHVQKLPFRARLVTTTHTPTVRTAWKWTVRVTNLKGNPVPASLRVYVLNDRGRRINTVGWFGVKGTLTKTYRWQTFLRGKRLTFQVVVVATGGKTALNYWIRPL